MERRILKIYKYASHLNYTQRHREKSHEKVDNTSSVLELGFQGSVLVLVSKLYGGSGPKLLNILLTVRTPLAYCWKNMTEASRTSFSGWAKKDF